MNTVKKIINLIISLALTFLGLTAITFIIGRVMPVDPAAAIVGDRAPRAVYEAKYHELGLDKPIIEQYRIYLTKTIQGDFGKSIMTANSVLEDLYRFFPATLEIATLSTIFGAIFGVLLGVFAAVNHGKWIDHIVRVVSLFGYSVPIFWLAMVLLLVFYAQLGWVAGPGRIDISYEGLVAPITGSIFIDAAWQGEWEVFRNAFSHAILPVSILTIYAIAYIARMTRSFMLDQLYQEYILTARIKGITERKVIWRHMLGNVLVQLITVIGLIYASLLEGSVLTEIIFGWPGIGQYITHSLFNGDMNAVVGGTVVVGACFVGINLISDFLYKFVDPRIKQAT